MTYHLLGSPLGSLLLAMEDGAVTGLWFDGQKASPKEAVPSVGAPSRIPSVTAWLARYFTGADPGPAPFPLKPKGTDFQKAVWNLLAHIPYGCTAAYGTLSAVLRERGLSASPRAVGNAVGRNPISILLPCHRVVGADGSLTGYAGGTERKAYLLTLEGALARHPMDAATFTAYLHETES